jgi:NAD(P)-dependent dehydrogenase (short-subunit alcohol dehydrogenase family)
MDRLLEKTRAIVTGASSGIGEAIARSFAKAGAAVIVNYRSSKEAAEKVVPVSNARFSSTRSWHAGQHLHHPVVVITNQECFVPLMDADPVIPPPIPQPIVRK